MSNDSTAAQKVVPFNFDAQPVRTVLINDQAWFCATDVCRVLGYANSRDAMSKHCREKGVAKRDTLTSQGRQVLAFIDEGNLYRLIIKSRKEEAQRFEAWVCDEVLPAIRKHGRYDDSDGKMNTLVGQTIGTDGFHMLGAVVKGKVSSLPAAIQRRATAKIWSQTHAAFGVRSAADIPADQLDAARNFIAAYAVEGEWLPKEERKLGTFVLDEFQAQNLNNLLHYTDWVNYRWKQGIGDAVKLLNPKFHACTWEFFHDAHRSAQRLERSLPELIAFFKDQGRSGLRPHECIAMGRSVKHPAD